MVRPWVLTLFRPFSTSGPALGTGWVRSSGQGTVGPFPHFRPADQLLYAVFSCSWIKNVKTVCGPSRIKYGVNLPAQ